MMSQLTLLLILNLATSYGFASPTAVLISRKVFNYQGVLPIKDDRTGAILTELKNETTAVETSNDTSAAEAACWQMINEQSGN